MVVLRKHKFTAHGKGKPESFTKHKQPTRPAADASGDLQGDGGDSDSTIVSGDETNDTLETSNISTSNISGVGDNNDDHGDDDEDDDDAAQENAGEEVEKEEASDQEDVEENEDWSEFVKEHGPQYKCGACMAIFDKRNLALRHYRQTHLGLRPYPCKLCPQKFKRGYALKRHVQAIHATTRPEVCQHCDAGFVNKDKLKRHQGGYNKGGVFLCR
jgi:hypothetical protein